MMTPCYNLTIQPNGNARMVSRMQAVKTPSVPALERGLAVLELIAKSKSGLTFSQLARSLNYPASSIHCLLLTFLRQGYLHRSETTGRYMCGLKLVRIANMALDGITLREKASPLLRDLCQRTGLTAHLAVRERNEAMVIAKVASVAGQHVATWIGKRIDVHCTSLGKCLVAYLPESEVDELIRTHGLLRHNENTISSPKKLKQELERTRVRGYAIDDQEEEIGMCCIGAPVFDASGTVIGAVSVSGTTLQIDLENCRPLVDAVIEAAAAIASTAVATLDDLGDARSISHGQS
jgi:DNA-binding IclR family transcriptional regulator